MAEGPTAFSSAAEDAINRTIDVVQISHDARTPLEDLYEVEDTIRFIVDGDFKRVALQFPDELLNVSVSIHRSLQSRLPGREVYVLADTSYGSCCADEVTAQHVDADVMIHYGHACLTPTSRLPVFYVFSKEPLDVAHCINSLLQAANLRSQTDSDSQLAVLLRCDVAYVHLINRIETELRKALPSCQLVIPKLSKLYDPLIKKEYAASRTDFDIEVGTILYVGRESLGLANLLITHAACNVYAYDPDARSAEIASQRTNKLLMRRYAAVQKARDADVFGILVGTLNIASYLPLITHLRKVLAEAQKKSYTICVGKLNPAKLANFIEVECFVLVACPENSLIDSKDFLRPIITPFELEAALSRDRSWTGRYILDFDRLLREIDSGTKDIADVQHAGDSDDDPDHPQFSLITGSYRNAKRFGDSSVVGASTTENAVTLRHQESSVIKQDEGAGFLHTRTFRGLEQRIGQDAPSVLEQGRSGLARGYQTDQSQEPSLAE
jgi:diphthamide biosynthesis protein 2